MSALDNIRRSIAQLTPRERLLLGFAGAGLVLFVGSIVFSSLNSSISRHEVAIEEKDGQLKQVAAYAQTYAEAERTRKELEGRLGGPPLRLLSHMQELCDRHGLTIGSMNDRGETTLAGLKESLVELQLGSAPIEKFIPLLNEVEKSQRPVKIRKLRVRTGTDPKVMQVNMTVATYALAAKADGKGDDRGGKE
jgi:type II secretory pathway component PulM